MKKSLMITIAVDNVELADLEKIQEKIDEIFDEYEYKRISTNIMDRNIVRPPGF